MEKIVKALQEVPGLENASQAHTDFNQDRVYFGGIEELSFQQLEAIIRVAYIHTRKVKVLAGNDNEIVLEFGEFF